MTTRKKTTPTPTPPTVSGHARKHGVSRETIRKIRDSGVDLDDELGFARALAVSRAKLSAPSPAVTQADGTESFSEAKRRRAVADADRAEFTAKREAGELIQVSEIEELMTRLGSQMRSRLLSWVGVLPPMFEGLSASRIQPILLEKVAELLAAIHESSPIKSKP